VSGTPVKATTASPAGVSKHKRANTSAKSASGKSARSKSAPSKAETSNAETTSEEEK
jgi:hypothetical protein